MKQPANLGTGSDGRAGRLVAVSATGPALEDQIDPAFGRCRFLLFVDPGTMGFEAVDNPGAGAVGGAGIQSAQEVARRGAQAVITGKVGPNALRVLDSAGITVLTDARGTVRESLEAYRSGTLPEAQSATARAHSGPGRRGRG